MSDIQKVDVELELPDFLEFGGECKCGRGRVINNKITGDHPAFCPQCDIDKRAQADLDAETRRDSSYQAQKLLEKTEQEYKAKMKQREMERKLAKDKQP